jgi:acetyl esterase/lipase
MSSSLPLFLALVLGAAPPRPYAIETLIDVPYVKDAGPRLQRLDVVTPRSATERFPVVVFVHGGTWLSGDKDEPMNRKAAQNLARNGVVVMVINYRLSPRVRHPEHAKDVASAFAWAVENAARYRGDPDRIVLVGHSAGGHLAALVAADERYLKDLGDKRKSLKGVVSLCGLYRMPTHEEFRRMAAPLIQEMVGDKDKSRFARLTSPVLELLSDGANPFPWVFGRGAEAQRDASPLSHVHKGMPPHLLVTAQWEVPSLREMAEEYSKALEGESCDVTYRHLEDCRHSTIMYDLHDNDKPACKLVLDFVKKHAGGPQPRGAR